YPRVRGFSLVETVIATALFALVALGAFEAVRQLAAATRQLAARHRGYVALERLTSQWRAEARSATAIWAGSPSAGGAHDDCVQVDFYAADAAGPSFWSYRSFPNHAPSEPVPGDALERLAGRAPLAPCDPSLHGAVVLSGQTAPLTVTTTAPDRLAAHADPYTAQPDSPFVAASVPATAPIPLGVLDAHGADVRGGNTLVELRVATADGARAVDLLPGVFPNGFTEVLRYTCSARCDVGHDTAAPKTLTTCALTWNPGWSTRIAWSDYVTNADGTLSFPSGWFVAGTFAFTYTGTRADGGIDSLAKPYTATNWDVARDYASFPPDRPAGDGSNAGSFAPWDMHGDPTSWLDAFAPYLAVGEAAPIAAERARCDAVRLQGTSSGFYANG
ncbi:MAG: prepilin-type N-terminal cleavage/methylation domain-containing protein, partial [Candidatus Eremiobacteraeota bacterium]|nr:prepilin-type N-terminal cleavage/methylation domain-containing protein [Candidatus Eremiobacteraeota bacterium]